MHYLGPPLSLNFIAHQQAFEGKLDELKKLVTEETDLNLNWQSEPSQLTALYVACQAGHELVVDYLLGVDQVDPNLSSITGGTPFSQACSLGHSQVVRRMLLDPRVYFNRPQTEGSTPFILACQNGHIEVVKLLADDLRIDVNQTRHDGTSLLDGKRQNNGTTPFYKAVERGHLVVVHILLESSRIQPSTKVKGVNPFYFACERGNDHMVRLLLEDDRVDINNPKYDGATPLFVAAQNGHLKVAQLILASGREVDVTKKVIFNGRTAAQQGKAMATRVKKDNETEEVHMRKKTYGPIIGDLLDAFEKDPVLTRKEITPIDPQLDATSLFTLIVCQKDGFLKVSETAPEITKRFFKIAGILPMELQMMLSNRSFGVAKDVVPTGEVERALRHWANGRPLWFP